IQDVRIALRAYLAKPLFTIVVLSVLGLAIGANSAIFTVVNAVLLRPLDYPKASALVSVSQRDRITLRRRSISPPNYFDVKDQARDHARRRPDAHRRRDAGVVRLSGRRHGVVGAAATLADAAVESRDSGREVPSVPDPERRRPPEARRDYRTGAARDDGARDA